MSTGIGSRRGPWWRGYFAPTASFAVNGWPFSHAAKKTRRTGAAPTVRPL